MMFDVQEMTFQDNFLQFGSFTAEKENFYEIQQIVSRPLIDMTDPNNLQMIRYEMNMSKYEGERVVYGLL